MVVPIILIVTEHADNVVMRANEFACLLWLAEVSGSFRRGQGFIACAVGKRAAAVVAV